jgi:predicted ATPase/DNA-binding CsgD family transcriptional regulator
MVDRTHEVRTILRMLTDDGVRLLTLVGPAGVGKTRLALAAAVRLADNFRDGVVVVEMATIRDHQSVLPTIARALGLTDTGQPPLAERLRDLLRERALLLALDNLEQALPAAAAPLADLLASCPDLTLLVTSRTPLQVRWEQTLRVPPLPVPDLSIALMSLAELPDIPSVTLFLQRARARRADFVLTERQAPLVAQLVTQLDGLPLAIELAAARLDVLSLSALTRRVAHRLDLLAIEAPDVPERQQSLEAAVGWSYDLLSEEEQRLFRCLGVFVGRVTLDAIVAVERTLGAEPAEIGNGEARENREAGQTLLRMLSLAEKSLLLPALPEANGGRHAAAAEAEDDEPAFGMLETVREYAWERLVAQGELTAARRAHAHYFLELAVRADALLRGPDQREWFLRLEREHDNLRAALRWLLEQEGPNTTIEREAALRLAGALGWFWSARGYHAEGMRWMEQALAHEWRAPADLEMDPPAVAAHTRALIGAGEFLAYQGNVELAQTVLGEALALARRRQDRASIAQALNYLGTCALFAGEVATAVPLLREALQCARDLPDPHPCGIALFLLGLAAAAQGDDAEAVARCQEALNQLEEAGDARVAGHVRFNLAGIVHLQGDLPRATAIVREGFAACAALRDRLLLTTGVRAALALVGERSDATQGARLLGAADSLTHATGATLGMAERVAADRVEAALRERLTQEDMAAAYRTGRALSFDEVTALALTLLDEVTRPPVHVRAGPPNQASGSAGPLTVREVEVLRLVAAGLSSKLIARQLSIAYSTVNYHLAAVFNKLAVTTRAQAVAVATQRGLL